MRPQLESRLETRDSLGFTESALSAAALQGTGRLAVIIASASYYSIRRSRIASAAWPRR